MPEVGAADVLRQGDGLARDRFRKICQLAGKLVRVHTSHNTADCKPLYASLRSIYFDDDEEVMNVGEDDEDDQDMSDEATQPEVEGQDS